MTPAELRKLLDAATPSGWSVEGMGGITMKGVRDNYRVMHGPLCITRGPIGAGNSSEQIRDDLQAIVALRNHADALLHAVEVLERLSDVIDSPEADAALAALREVKP
jgi:hypothetical protein